MTDPNSMVRMPHNPMKPIPTKYRGVNFKSRTEARWAVFFDNMPGWMWEYESRTVKTKTGRYTPDFWLPILKVFAEVKPEWPTRLELEKMRHAARSSDGCLLLIGWPEVKEYWLVEAVTEMLVKLYGDIVPAPMGQISTQEDFPETFRLAVRSAQSHKFDGYDDDRKIISERYA